MKSIIIYLAILLIQWRTCTCAPHTHRIRDDAGDNFILSEHSPGKGLTRELRQRQNYCPTIFGLSLQLGEIGSRRTGNSQCLIIECIQVHGALSFDFNNVRCSDLDSVSCSDDLSSQRVEALKCCSRCSTAPVSSIAIPEENITTTSISVKWVYDENDQTPITGVTITYTATNNNATPSDGVISACSPDTSAIITGLQPLTTYSIGVYVESELSPIFGSSPAKFGVADTLPLAPFSPLIITVTVVGQTEMNVEWTAIHDPKFQTELHMYKVKYCEEEGNETAVYVRHPDISIKLTDLKPSTCYTIMVCAINTGGSSPNSNSVIACTVDDDNEEEEDEHIHDYTELDPDAVITK